MFEWTYAKYINCRLLTDNFLRGFDICHDQLENRVFE